MTIEGTLRLRDVLPPVLGGFSGALFAFLFMRLADSINRRRDRFARHEHALVGIQWLMSDLINAISKNKYQVEQFLKGLAHMREKGGVWIAPNRPHVLIFRDETLDGMGNRALLNEIASFRADIRATNADIETVWGVHERFLDLALRDRTRIPDYMENFEQCAEYARLLHAAHAQLLDRALTIMCKLRILIVDARRLVNRRFVFAVRAQYPRGMESRVLRERDQLLKEESEARHETASRLEDLDRHLRESGPNE